MALSILVTEQVYTGDGSTTNFAIPFTFFSNSQVVVEETDTGTGTITTLTNGTEYTISGGDPGTTVVATTAPTSTKRWRVYRSTPLTQIWDFINNTTVNLENIEKALDRIVMMAQELNSRDISVDVASGSYNVIAVQTISAGGTIVSDNTKLRKICYVQGGSGGTTASTTTAIDNGLVDGQEIVLIGRSNDNPLTISATSTSNMNINGDVVLFEGNVLTVVWDSTNNKWIELNRR